jgi:signal transduction histidine kinase
MPASALLHPVPRGSIESFDVKSGLTSHRVLGIDADREGNIWCLTTRGLDQFHPNPFHVADLPYGNAMALTRRIPDGATIVGTDRLVVVADGQARQLTDRFATGLRSLYGAEDGSLWGGGDDKLFRFADGKVTEQKMPQDLKVGARGVQSITEDAQHGIWISVIRNGVFRLFDGEWTRKGGHPEIPDQPAVSVGKDQHKNIWLGYLDGTAVSISPTGNVHLYDPLHGPRIGPIKVFSVIGENLVIGGDEGIAILRGGHFQRLLLKDSSLLRGVTGLALSQNGDLWVNGSTGAVRIPKNDFSMAIANQEYRPTFELFDYHEGVQGVADPIAGLSSAVVGEDGKLYMLASDHLNWIDPLKIRPDSTPPQVTIDEVESDSESVFWPIRALTLPSNPQNLRIRYKAGTLLVPDRVRFRYRLENFDKDWINVGERREALYPKLPPGNYTFQVLAANEAGVWNKVGASVSFRVPPTITQTTWFRLALGLSLIGMLLLAFRIRLDLTRRRVANHMYGIFAERQHIARDLHDTLLQSMQAILFKFSVATKKLPDDDPVRSLLETTLAQSDQVLLEGRRLLKDLKSEEESVSVLVDSFRRINEELRAAYPSPQFAFDVRGDERIISSVVGREVCMFGREALNNAFRHSGAAHVWFSLHADPDELRLQVRDDGQGIEPEILAKGYRDGHWGLQNMKERAERLGARYRMLSSPGSGTAVEIAIPAYMAYPDQVTNSRTTLQTLREGFWRRKNGIPSARPIDARD